jgi:hypothetical protein
VIPYYPGIGLKTLHMPAQSLSSLAVLSCLALSAGVVSQSWVLCVHGRELGVGGWFYVEGSGFRDMGNGKVGITIRPGEVLKIRPRLVTPYVRVCIEEGQQSLALGRRKFRMCNDELRPPV